MPRTRQRDDENDDDTPIRSRRPQTGRPLQPLLVAGGLVLVAVCLGVGVWMATRGKGGGSAGGGSEQVSQRGVEAGSGGLPVVRDDPVKDTVDLLTKGESWTHAELLDYLKSKGVKFTKVTGGVTLLGISQVLIKHDKTDIQSESAETEYVTISLHDNSRKAREHASADESGFSWGRFTFTTSEKNKNAKGGNSLVDECATTLGARR